MPIFSTKKFSIGLPIGVASSRWRIKCQPSHLSRMMNDKYAYFFQVFLVLKLHDFVVLTYKCFLIGIRAMVFFWSLSNKSVRMHKPTFSGVNRFSMHKDDRPID